MTDTNQTAREYVESDPIDRAIAVFHEMHPLAGNEPYDWPEKFMNSLRAAMKEAVSVAPAGLGSVTFVVDPKQSIDEVLPLDRRLIITDALCIVAEYRSCPDSEALNVIKRFCEYMQAVVADREPVETHAGLVLPKADKGPITSAWCVRRGNEDLDAWALRVSFRKQCEEMDAIREALGVEEDCDYGDMIEKIESLREASQDE